MKTHVVKTKENNYLSFSFFTARIYEGWAMYRCLSVNTQEVPHLNPIILPLVLCPFWGYPSDWSQVPSWGYPSARWWGTPVPGEEGTPVPGGYLSPRWRYPSPRQGSTPVPGRVTPVLGYLSGHLGQDWGTPRPPRLNSRAVCLLHSRRRTFF